MSEHDHDEDCKILCETCFNRGCDLSDESELWVSQKIGNAWLWFCPEHSTAVQTQMI